MIATGGDCSEVDGMQRIYEKGTTVNPIEQSVQKPSRETGISATLRGLVRAAGIGRSLVAVVAVVVGALLFAPGALAAGPPSFIKSNIGQEVFSTRVTIEGVNGLVLALGELDTEWKAEYSSVSSSGPWTEVNTEHTGTPPSDLANVFIGVEDQLVGGLLAHSWLRHLAPGTSYYARFLAKNADGEAEEIIPFKTLPVGKPEIDKSYLREFTNGGAPSFLGGSRSDTTAEFKAAIEGNGAETAYGVEYAPAEAGGGRPADSSASWKPFTSGATGTVSVAEEHAVIEAGLSGLAPETTYYVRIKASNSQGEIIQAKYLNGGGVEVGSFTTGTAKPVVDGTEVRNRTIDSVHASSGVFPHGSETRWRFEYAESALGPWSVVPGGGGTISQEQAEATPYGREFHVGAGLSGLSASKEYYVRLFAENAAGEGEFCSAVGGSIGVSCEPVSSETGGVAVFETFGPPSVTTFAVHGLVGEALQLFGGVNPESTPTSAEQTIVVEGAPTGGTFTLTFGGHATKPLAYDAPADEGEGSGSVGEALRHELGLDVGVEGPAGGPYTVFFFEPRGVSEPAIEADGSALTPLGVVSVHTDFKGGEATEVHYRFQYVSEAGFAESGWAGAQETPEVVASPGAELVVVNAVLPALIAGESYRYRLVGSTSASGVGVVYGAEQSLSVPVPPGVSQAAGCPNEALRAGLSAQLPDCRAYEQLSPVEKPGSQEPFQYGVELGDATLHPGGDGEHAVFEGLTVSWGVGPGAGGSPYFFAREAGKGWRMTAGSPQPETGLDNVRPELYSADTDAVAFEAKYDSSRLSESEMVEYKVGPAGGPYTTVASVPQNAVGNGEGWVAANGSFSKLVFATQDRELLGGSTGTRSGADLYEYTAQGGLRQLNVSGEQATTIGSCGARMVYGVDEQGMNNPRGAVSGPRSVSADGSHVFFYAGRGHECPTPAEFEAQNFNGANPRVDLYMRVDGSETVDIGAYRFLGANVSGSRLMLENGAREVLGYDVATGAIEARSGGELGEARELALLGIPERVEAGTGTEAFLHPRYIYWGSHPHAPTDHDEQAYRYDRVEHLVQCISCASPYDPSPKQPAFVISNVGVEVQGGVQNSATASANGEFAFFTTPAALVAQDVDGEIGIEGNEGTCESVGCLGSKEYANISGTTSPSSDVYEWRAPGVDGCARLQGCVALITSGRGGYQNILLGSADEGRDVFIYTRSTLVAQVGRPEGSLGEGNIYDARVDGGFAPLAPRPTECEGDACSTPPSAPNDATPSSLTFTGAGNIIAPPAGKPAVKSKKPKRAVKKQKSRRRVTHGRKTKARRGGAKAGRTSTRTGLAEGSQRRVK
jgi:hypothetical protein